MKPLVFAGLLFVAFLSAMLLWRISVPPQVQIGIAIAVFAAVTYAMQWCKRRRIDNPILTFRLWLRDRKAQEQD
jgi:hypothetical protein